MARESERPGTEICVTPPQAEKATRTAGGIVLLLLVAAFAIGLALASAAPHDSYDDGYGWGQANAISSSKTVPSCSRSEMASDAQVGDPNFIFYKPQGDDRPNDNFARWRAGCEAGARSTLAEN